MPRLGSEYGKYKPFETDAQWGERMLARVAELAHKVEAGEARGMERVELREIRISLAEFKKRRGVSVTDALSMTGEELSRASEIYRGVQSVKAAPQLLDRGITGQRVLGRGKLSYDHD